MIHRDTRNRKISKQKQTSLKKIIAVMISVLLLSIFSVSVLAQSRTETLTLPNAGISALIDKTSQTTGDLASSKIKSVILSSTNQVCEINTEKETECVYEEKEITEECTEEYTEEYIEEYTELADNYIEEYSEEISIVDDTFNDETYIETEPYIEETTSNDVQPSIDVTSNSSIRQNVADLAASLVGITQYVWAGRSLYSTDCSGFVYLLYGQFGLYASPASDDYMNPDGFGYFISESELQPGDIVVYRYGGHVAVYEGNGQIVHCADYDCGTIWSSMYYDTPSAFVRINGTE